jgi:hypothetical protein
MFIRVSMMARLALLVGIVLVTSGYAACSFSSGPNGGVYPPNPGSPVNGDAFVTTLTLRDVSGVETRNFVFGESIRFDLEILNTSNSERRVQFPDGQTHDFLVVNQGSTRVIWLWSDGKSFTQASTELVFAPYASKTITAIWTGVLADGTQLGVGNYQARGALVYPGFETSPLAPNELASPLEAFTVR